MFSSNFLRRLGRQVHGRLGRLEVLCNFVWREADFDLPYTPRHEVKQRGFRNIKHFSRLLRNAMFVWWAAGCLGLDPSPGSAAWSGLSPRKASPFGRERLFLNDRHGSHYVRNPLSFALRQIMGQPDKFDCEALPQWDWKRLQVIRRRR